MVLFLIGKMGHRTSQGNDLVSILQRRYKNKYGVFVQENKNKLLLGNAIYVMSR